MRKVDGKIEQNKYWTKVLFIRELNRECRYGKADRMGGRTAKRPSTRKIDAEINEFDHLSVFTTLRQITYFRNRKANIENREKYTKKVGRYFVGSNRTLESEIRN